MITQDNRLHMLYLCHTPWDWIKQRPHFIAEYLSESYNVAIYHPKYYRTKRLVKNGARLSLNSQELFGLPYSRFSLISKINSFLTKYQVKHAIRDADIVWVTFPSCFGIIKDILPKDTMLIYDCMDDALAFGNSKSKNDARKNLQILEEQLVKRCDIIFVSSANLEQKLNSRYDILQNIHIVNNAVEIREDELLQESENIRAIEKRLGQIKQRKLMYFGTISEWLDWDLICESLSRYPDIVYIFMGPADIILPKHDRILLFSPVDHQYVYRLMKQADVLIMPFKISELIESVNPVKLYEYIHSCKPAIAVEYDETKKFDEYIYTYKDRSEYLRLIGQMLQGNLNLKRNCKDSISYVKNHTWEKRVELMVKTIVSRCRV